MMKTVKKLRNLGIKPGYQIWEAFLTRKINFITCIGTFNLVLSVILFPFLGLHDFQNILLVCIGLAPIVFLLNIKVNYVWGAYGFYAICLILMTYFPVKMGMNSYFLLFFFPVTFSVVQLLGRKETLVHMIVVLTTFLLVIAFVAYCYLNNLYALPLNEKLVSELRMFNILLSAFTGLAFITQITIENQKQERMIRQMLSEKDVLMAEVFHRVKNNMNIITSLLNLRKNISDSADVKEALEECRNRVFSMALVHEKIFQRNNISGLNFAEYVRELTKEIRNSIGIKDSDEIIVEHNNLDLPLSSAIPCGLILNELVTNSYKHARLPGQKLVMRVKLTEEGGKKKMEFFDNGPGVKSQDLLKENSLGTDLIKSLSEQINGTCVFSNDNGLHFILTF